MKKGFASILLVIVIMLSFIITPAYAMPGGNWASGVKIQNLNSTTAAILTVGLYSSEGVLAATISTTANGNPLTAPVGSSVEVYLPAYATIDGGQYSAIITSNVAVSAVVTTTNYDYGMADSYNAMQPAKTISVPYVYHNHNAYSTEIFMRNTTGVAANVTVTYKEPVSSVSYADAGLHEKVVNVTIPANGYRSLDTTTVAFDDLQWFIGAATVSSDQDLTVVANQVRLVGVGDIAGNLMISSRGLISSDSGTKVVVPSLYKEFTGASGTWRSGIKIQNPNSSVANVTVVFKSDPEQPAWTGTKTLTINANDNAELYLPGLVLDNVSPIPDMFKGSAVITSNIMVVANVQHTNYAGAGGFGVGMGYTGFSAGGTKLSLPSLYNWPSGAGVWVSGIKIQNLGGSDVVVKATFTPDADSISQLSGTASNRPLPANSAIELYFGAAILDGGLSIPLGWKGSAVIEITSGTSTIAATVIHTNYGRHVANMYTSIIVP